MMIIMIMIKMMIIMATMKKMIIMMLTMIVIFVHLMMFADAIFKSLLSRFTLLLTGDYLKCACR